MIQANPDAAKGIVRKRFGDIEADIYEAAWNSNVAAFPRNPRMDERDVGRAIAFLTEIAGEKVPGAARDYVDDSYADAAVASLKMKRFLLAIAAIALLGFSLSSAEAAERVRVGMPTEGFLYTPLYLAIDAGFMKEEGIEAELIQFKGGGAAMGGLVSGSVEFCTCAIQNAINATVKGSGVTLIGTIIGQYASNMVLRDDVAKRLGITHETPIKQRLAALRGLTIAGSGVGSSTDFLIRYLAKAAGLSPERDFTVLFLADGGPILAAFSAETDRWFSCSPSPTSDMAVLKY